MMIADWELGQLFLAMRQKYQDERIAVQKVKDKFLGELCSTDRDPCFFLGTQYLHPNNWLVLGVFWPPREPQMAFPF